MNRIYFFAFFSFLSTFCFSQEQAEPQFPQPPVKQFKNSIKAGAGLPIILANSPFSKTMDGVYSVNATADFTIYKPIIAGVYYNYSMVDNAELKNNKGRRADVTKGFFSSAGASIGYENFFDENKILSISANSGYSWIHYKYAVTMTDTVKNLFRTEALNLGITASYSIVVEETGCIGFYVSYRLINDIFDPRKISLIAEESNKKTQFFVPGIIFTYGF